MSNKYDRHKLCKLMCLRLIYCQNEIYVIEISKQLIAEMTNQCSSADFLATST